MLHLSSRWEVESFLKERQAYLHYTEADLRAIREVVQP
jgi:hypothetical protein